ncbi:MAG: signal transduction histidine kinase [Rhodothermales bacterium]
MTARSIILLLATVVIPGLALAAVGVVLVQQHGELAERRTEDQARLRAREASDSLRALLDDRLTAVPPASSLRYPGNNGVLNLGGVQDGAFQPPFADIPSALSERRFQLTLAGLHSGSPPSAYREAARQARSPDQRAFFEIREAEALGEATEAALELVRSGTRFADEFGIPLSLWAMEATDQRDRDFAPSEWLNFGAIAYARDLGVDGFATGEHDILAHVRGRFSAIENWRLSPDSSWMIRRVGDAFVGIRMDSVRALASVIPGVHSLAASRGAQGYALNPSFPFLQADIETDRAVHLSLLWMLALGLVTMVTAFGALNLLRDARRDRRLAQLRAGFVSSVSHEVRTPPAGIRLLTDSLLTYGPGSSDEWRRDLETISYETDRLTRMLDNVLRASRIERGADRYHLRRTRQA